MFSLRNLELKVRLYKANDDHHKIENLTREKKRPCVIAWYPSLKKIDGRASVLYPTTFFFLVTFEILHTHGF